jgi:hypothetical protein
MMIWIAALVILAIVGLYIAGQLAFGEYGSEGKL